VDFFLVSRQRWDISATSRLRAAPVVAWACGFAAYQLVYPGTVPGWADFWAWGDESIGFVPPSWLGSSVAAIAVGGLVMFISGLLLRHRQDAHAEHSGERVS
jgi:nucleobase:cation symporter-1, NCS1 family